MLQDWKTYCLQARPCSFQPGTFTGWPVKGLKMYGIKNGNGHSFRRKQDKTSKKSCFFFCFFVFFALHCIANPDCRPEEKRTVNKVNESQMPPDVITRIHARTQNDRSRVIDKQIATILSAPTALSPVVASSRAARVPRARGEGKVMSNLTPRVTGTRRGCRVSLGAAFFFSFFFGRGGSFFSFSSLSIEMSNYFDSRFLGRIRLASFRRGVESRVLGSTSYWHGILIGSLKRKIKLFSFIFFFLGGGGGEGGERKRKRETERDRQTDTQTEKERLRETQTQRDRQTDRNRTREAGERKREGEGKRAGVSK